MSFVGVTLATSQLKPPFFPEEQNQRTDVFFSKKCVLLFFMYCIYHSFFCLSDFLGQVQSVKKTVF